MSWDADGQRIEDDDEAGDFAAQHHDGEHVGSGLDRANLVWMIDAYAGEKKLLLVRIATAGPEFCTLSAPRLARDCNIHPRTAEKYRSDFVQDGVLHRERDEKGRTVFRIDWHEILGLAGEGLKRRPAAERVKIVESTLRSIIVRNVLPHNRATLECLADPSTPQLDAPPRRLRQPNPDAIRHLSGHARRKLEQQTPTPGELSVPPGELSVPPGELSVPPGNTPGPSKPESNPNPEPESLNGASSDAPHIGRSALDPIQATYRGKPTLIVQALELLRDGHSWSPFDVARELGMKHQTDAGRVLRDLCQRGYAERIDHGRYMLTEAARSAA